MTITSPQAAVTQHRDAYTLALDAVTTSRNIVVRPPKIVAANGEVLDKQFRAAFRQIQNCGTNAVKFLVDNVANCTEENFHGILAACTSTDDGLGSIANFGKTGDRVTIFSTSGTHRVCVFEAIAPEGNL